MKMTTQNSFYYYNLVNDTTMPVKEEATLPCLPKKFAEKTNKVHTAAEIEARAMTATTNRLRLQEETVNKARLHDEKVQQVQNTKKSFDENMTLIGSTVPLAKRGNVPVSKLPKRLQMRLASLPAKKSANQLLEKENAAAERRTELLSARKVKVIGMRKACKAVEKPAAVEAEADSRVAKLPARLQARLASLPAKKSTDEIIAKNLLADMKRASMVTSRKQFAALQNAGVAAKLAAKGDMMELSTKAQLLSADTQLPKALQHKLNTYPHGCDDNGKRILAKEAAVSAKRAALLAKRKANAQDHNMRVKERMITKALQAPVSVNVAAPQPVNSALPKNLVARLAALEAQKHTPEQIIAKEQRAELKRLSLLHSKKQVCASANLAALEKGRLAAEAKKEANVAEMKRQAHLPKRLQKRLAAFKKPTADEILLKEENAVLKRAQQLSLKKNKAGKFTQARKPMEAISTNGETFPGMPNRELPRTPMNQAC